MKNHFAYLLLCLFAYTALTGCSEKADHIPVTEIKLNKTELTLGIGETYTFTATVTPESEAGKTITWSSSDDAVVSVDDNGLIKALMGGKAIITATAGNKTGECEVTVEPTRRLCSRRRIAGRYSNYPLEKRGTAKVRHGLHQHP